MKDNFAKLIDVKSIVTLTLTFVLAYLLLGNVTVKPEILALFSAAYGSMTTYFFTKKESKGS